MPSTLWEARSQWREPILTLLSHQSKPISALNKLYSDSGKGGSSGLTLKRERNRRVTLQNARPLILFLLHWPCMKAGCYLRHGEFKITGWQSLASVMSVSLALSAYCRSSTSRQSPDPHCRQPRRQPKPVPKAPVAARSGCAPVRKSSKIGSGVSAARAAIVPVVAAVPEFKPVEVNAPALLVAKVATAPSSSMAAASGALWRVVWSVVRPAPHQ